MYRIFINDNLLFISTSETLIQKEESIEVIHYLNPGSLDVAINQAYNHSVNLVVKDLFLIWKDLSTRYELIQAAGGLILNHVGSVLWIFRNDRWDLPKGKVEPNESITDAALREVEEECSISGASLGPFLGTTYHIYIQKGTKVLKSSHWYLMTCDEQQVLKPQLEEGITKVIWADAVQHEECLKNTYSSIVELLKREKVQHFLCFE